MEKQHEIIEKQRGKRERNLTRAIQSLGKSIEEISLKKTCVDTPRKTKNKSKSATF